MERKSTRRVGGMDYFTEHFHLDADAVSARTSPGKVSKPVSGQNLLDLDSAASSNADSVCASVCMGIP